MLKDRIYIIIYHIILVSCPQSAPLTRSLAMYRDTLTGPIAYGSSAMGRGGITTEPLWQADVY